MVNLPVIGVLLFLIIEVIACISKKEIKVLKDKLIKITLQEAFKKIQKDLTSKEKENEILKIINTAIKSLKEGNSK